MDRLYIFMGGPGSGCEATGGEGGNGCGGEANLLVRAEVAEAVNTQLDGIATTLMESNRKLAEALEAEKARADEAEAALAAAVQDMEAMALTIRQRTDHDTDCCPFCHYNGSEEDYCPGWEGEECFQWRGKC